jgi:hypothetical protein
MEFLSSMGFLLIPGIPFVFHSYFNLWNSLVSTMGVSISHARKEKNQNILHLVIGVAHALNGVAYAAST